MILFTLYYEFFKIGLFAIGGGLVTIPFLFDLATRYPWFDAKLLSNMIAISESTPGPIGVNMATFSGFQAGGITGGIIATFGLVTPSVVIIMLIAKLMKKYKDDERINKTLASVRPAVLGLILFACYEIAKISIVDIKTSVMFMVFFVLIFHFKKNPIIYITLSAIAGVVFKI
ncbi:MAG: putative chromate transport protein [Alphaproteobacteria bacterium ADurb.Bin438]|nr:MAG: putative chromate transport protein [Alphaproteobacteria bacterium ADurb.Bin438]